MGEPFQSAFEPSQLPGWLSARGFRLEHDESSAESATRHLGIDPLRAKSLRATLSHFALARRAWMRQLRGETSQEDGYLPRFRPMR